MSYVLLTTCPVFLESMLLVSIRGQNFQFVISSFSWRNTELRLWTQSTQLALCVRWLLWEYRYVFAGFLSLQQEDGFGFIMCLTIQYSYMLMEANIKFRQYICYLLSIMIGR